MKFFVVIFCFTFGSVFSQQYSFKERFDILEQSYTTNSYNYESALNRPCVWVNWGDILSSYLNLFKATGDKAYLNKFVKHSFNILTYRSNSDGEFPFFWDMSGFGFCSGSDSYAYREEMSFHYTGRLIMPMCEFQYIVNQLYPYLQSAPLLSGMAPYTTFGEFSNYLQSRTQESLDIALEKYYVNDTKGFTQKANDQNYGTSINQQASWGAALLYAGKVNPYKPFYVSKGKAMSYIFKGLLSTYSPNNSFTWMHSKDTYLREDVAHAFTDLRLAIVAYELYGSELWSTAELNKFCHTFTYNIWDRSTSTFRNNVFGMIEGNDPSIVACSGSLNINTTPNFWAPGEIINWIAIYLWDDVNASTHSVYNILKEQTKNLLNNTNPILPSNYCYSNTSFLSGTHSYCGLSELVRAQWREECVNLTLGNRDVVYDQTFDVKNILTIDPSTTTTSFADPVINTPNFIIRPNTNVNILAGEAIVLKPGFSSLSGSNTKIAIINTGCEAAGRFSNPNFIDVLDKKIVPDLDITIFPNPSSDGHLNLRVTTVESGSIEILIFDILGKVILNVNQQTLPVGESSFDFDLESGIYIIKTNFKERTISQKVIVN